MKSTASTRPSKNVLLPDVEEGVAILVGATTENPFFTINSALVSRSRVFQFEPLSADDVKALLRRAIADKERGLGQYKIHLHHDALDFLAEVSDGDARRALSALEVGVLSSVEGDSPIFADAKIGTVPSAKIGTVPSAKIGTVPESPVEFTRQLAEESVQRKAIQYDRQGDVHYDAISALIKSIRGSDPDAALYWLARMLEGGEDVRFLARRLVILASEDVGNADPAGLPLAVAAAHACELVGLPECQLTLAQAATYLACARNRTPRRSASARPGPTSAKAGCCRCRCISVIRTTPARNASVTAKDTSTPTTPPKASPPRIISASSASTIAPPIAASSANWPSGSRRFASACGERASSSRVWTMGHYFDRRRLRDANHFSNDVWLSPDGLPAKRPSTLMSSSISSQ